MKSGETKKLHLLVVFFLIALNVFLLLKVTNRHKNADVVSGNQNGNYAIRSLTEAVTMGYKTEGLPIFLKNNHDSLFLLTLIHDRVLILRISDTNCEACTTEALSDLLEYSSSIVALKVVLANFSNSRSIDVLKISYPNLIILNEASIDLPIERINTPYLFLTNRSMLTDMVFVHQKEFPEKTKGYFEALQARLNR